MIDQSGNPINSTENPEFSDQPGGQTNVMPSKAKRRTPWIGGAVLILLGVIFLLQNLGMLFLTNWWALFILIPAYWSFVAAWRGYRRNGYLTRRVTVSLVSGFFWLALSFVFLLNMDLGQYWPILLILGGLALLFTSIFPEREKS